ncbi:MAG: glycosyltransferase family 4 protein [Candidatus Pacebacteria bacterium]|nr:glycosyltransferase family 4 protein [Candidatus Paceibacterota bacterium]
MKNLKILMVIKTMRLDGGVETSVASIVNEVYSRGCNVFIVSFTENYENDLLQRLDIPKDKILHLGKIKTVNILYKIYKLRKIIRKEKFNIIHTHLFHASLVGRLASIGLNCSAIATEHSTFFNWWKWYHYLIDRMLSHNITKEHIAVSRSVAATLAARTGILPNKINIINNAVDTKRFKFDRGNNTKRNIKNILLVGRLEYSKNIDYALKIFEEISIKNTSLTLTISGDGTQKEQLKNIYKNNTKIKFIGVEKDISSLMKKMDVLFLSSHWEGCPMTIIESFSVGLPVIATSVPGVIDIVSDQITGILIDPEKIKESSEKIEKFINNKELQNYITKNARKESERFSPKNITDKLIEVYTKSLKKKDLINDKTKN